MLKIWSLPVENPPAGEDIYRLDTTVRVHQNGREWANLAPEGCVHAPSSTEASAEQRATFKEIVAAIKRAVST